MRDVVEIILQKKGCTVCLKLLNLKYFQKVCRFGRKGELGRSKHSGELLNSLSPEKALASFSSKDLTTALIVLARKGALRPSGGSKINSVPPKAPVLS